MNHLLTNRGLWIALLTALFVACKQQPKSLFTLEGTLTHLTSDTVYLMSTEPSFDRIDTLVVKKGLLHYVTPLDTLVPMTLLCNDTILLPIYGDKNLTVQLTFDGRKPNRWKVEGGTMNEELQTFRQWADTVRNVKTLEAGVDTFLNQHPLSHAGIRLFNQYLAQQKHPNYMLMNRLIRQMSGLLHDDPLVATLEDRVDRSLRSDTGRYVSSFQTRNVKGKTITSYSFHDKILVAYVGATWDANSKAVRDSLKKVQPRYKEKAGFLFHSIDTDKGTWLKNVEADTIYGEQTYAPEGWEANVVKLFGVEQVPTVLILNKQRKIIYKRNDLTNFTHVLDSIMRVDKMSAKWSK